MISKYFDWLTQTNSITSNKKCSLENACINGVWLLRLMFSKRNCKCGVATLLYFSVWQADDERGVPQLPHLRQRLASTVQEHQEARQVAQHHIGEVL